MGIIWKVDCNTLSTTSYTGSPPDWRKASDMGGVRQRATLVLRSNALVRSLSTSSRHVDRVQGPHELVITSRGLNI